MIKVALNNPLDPLVSSPALIAFTIVTDNPISEIICSFLTLIIVSEFQDSPEVRFVKTHLAVSLTEFNTNVNSAFSGTFNGSITLMSTGPPSNA